MDFLENDEAEKLFDHMDNVMPEDWWFFSSFVNKSGQGYSSKPENIRRFDNETPEIQKKLTYAQSGFDNGHFSYAFDRTINNHHSDCPCVECQFKAYLRSDELLDFVRVITGIDVSTPQEVFMSRFLGGHFLSPHHDINKGKIGFVLSLSKGWRPELGGNLHFMDEDYVTVQKVIPPRFNRLTLFDITSRNGIPHFVSHVVPTTTKKRYSITGWFD
jgi:Rps23 Pro-64 3,4-dihydroxylase Tpa1-like proline 4-hydroxylase